MLGKIEDRRRRGQQRTDAVRLSVSNLQELVQHRAACVLQPMGPHSRATEQQQREKGRLVSPAVFNALIGTL